MSPNDTNTSTKTYPLVNAIVDLGAAWAAHGLEAGRLSLESSALVLTRTAKALEGLAREIQKTAKTVNANGTPSDGDAAPTT